MRDRNIIDPFYAQIQGEVNRIERKANNYTCLFYCIRIAQIFLTGSITVLAGISDSHYQIYILIFGALVTALTALDTLFHVDTRKNTYKTILFELRTIRTEFVYKQLQTGKVDDLRFREELFEKYRKLNAFARGLIGHDPDKNQEQSAHSTQPQNGVSSGNESKI